MRKDDECPASSLPWTKVDLQRAGDLEFLHGSVLGGRLSIGAGTLVDRLVHAPSRVDSQQEQVIGHVGGQRSATSDHLAGCLGQLALAEDMAIGELALEKSKRGELFHHDESRPVRPDEIETALGDLRRLTEGGIFGS